MKSIIKILSVLLIINASTWFAPQQAKAQVGVSFQIFYDNLSPYGTWVNYPAYGYAWIPGVGAGFSPYATSGHWVFSQYGWLWVSDYSWGWAPFHYGRWYFDPIYGWIWIPDVEWGPAWVTWCSSPGYYGWAPIGPGVTINLVLGGGYHPPREHWVFVPEGYIGRSDIQNYYGPRNDNERLLKSSTGINRTAEDNGAKYISGPDRTDVEKRTGKQIQPVEVKQNDKPGQKQSGNEISLYRPRVEKAAANGAEPKPKRVADLKEVKPLNERTGNKQVEKAGPQKMENKKVAPKKEAAPVNKTPEQNNEKEKPAPPRENTPAGKDQTPPREENAAPGNDKPQQDLNKPNEENRQQAEPARENPQEIKQNEEPKQPQVAPPDHTKSEQQAPPPPQKSKGKNKKPPKE